MSIEQAYNSWSEIYDTNENKTRDLDKKATISVLSKYNFKSVLELGCGTGKNTKWLIERADEIIGLDFSQKMLDIAARKIKNRKVVLKKSDLTKDWDIKNNFADLITCSLTLEHIENLDHIFDQAYLKLKPNGLLFISELHPFKQYSGTKARYETKNEIKELEVYTHHISEYLDCAKNNSFHIVELKEWFDDQQSENTPRLLTLVFKNNL
ncbi:MAG: class I SAM-dependent methyltransferase [Bacteroidota bacterium]